eukprot:gene12144-7816_t
MSDKVKQMSGADRSNGYMEALGRTAVAVAAAHTDGGVAASYEWYTCYLIEETLSLDNLFAFYLVFKFFKVPLESQNRVLQWGIIGAVVMRAIMVGAGALIVKQFHAVLLLFALILLYQGLKITFVGEDDDDDDDLEDNKIIKASKWLVPVTSSYHDSKFFVREDGKLKATPLLLVLISIEFSDVVFAIDSVPAAF